MWGMGGSVENWGSKMSVRSVTLWPCLGDRDEAEELIEEGVELKKYGAPNDPQGKNASLLSSGVLLDS